MLPNPSDANKKVLIKRSSPYNLQNKKLSVFIHVELPGSLLLMATQALKAAPLVNSGPCHRVHPARPSNDLGEINKYVNVYFLLNLKAASIKIFDF